VGKPDTVGEEGEKVGKDQEIREREVRDAFGNSFPCCGELWP